jgi:hypothetical protein
VEVTAVPMRMIRAVTSFILILVKSLAMLLIITDPAQNYAPQTRAGTIPMFSACWR